MPIFIGHGAPLRTKPRTFSFAVRNDSLKDVLAADDPDRVVVYFDRTDDGADSRYDRQVADLPCAGKQIHLWVITRRFVCEVPHCRRQISLNDVEMMFCRPVCAGRAQLECIVYDLGLALGGTSSKFRQAADVAGQQRSLLRVVRRRIAPRADPLTVVGVDD